MPPLSDRLLLAWLAGALDPGRASEVAEDVAADPMLQARVAALGAQLADPPAAPSFRLPPPTRPSFGMRRQLAIAMGDTTLRPGDRFRLALDPPDDAERIVVVLRRVTSDWSVVFPTDPDEVLPVGALPTEDGSPILDLVVDRPGRQRWAVALPAASVAIDWTAPEATRWQALSAGIADGSIPVTSIELEVEAAA